MIKYFLIKGIYLAPILHFEIITNFSNFQSAYSIFMYKYLLFLILIIGIRLNAQEVLEVPDFLKQRLSFEGVVGTSANFYNASGIDARRPSNVSNVFLNSKLLVGRYIQIPANINFTSLPVHYGSFETQQSFGDFSLMDFVVNPINTFNTGLYYKDLKWDIGTVSNNMSRLTMSGVPMFGTGVSFNHKKLILQTNHGISQHAIERDLDHNIIGQYKRTLQSYKLGMGNLNRSYFAFNFIKGEDDTTSITMDSLSTEAQVGVVAGFDFGFRITKNLRFSGEFASSLFTSDLTSSDIEFDHPAVNAINKILPFKLSTFADIAFITELNQTYKKWSLGMRSEYIGAGFRTMGQPFLQADRLDLTVSPRTRLFKNKINLNLTGGYRVNNLSGTKGNTMNQFISNSSITANITDDLMLYVQYSNFGVENNVIGDSLRIRNITQTLVIAPVYTTEDNGGRNTYNLNLTLNDFEDFNAISGALNSNVSQVYSGGIYRSFYKKPLTIGFSLSSFNLNSELLTINTNNVSITTGYKFFEDKLKLNLITTYSMNKNNGSNGSSQITSRLRTSYETKDGWSFSLSASNNSFDYSASSALDFYRENLLEVGLTKSFN